MRKVIVDLRTQGLRAVAQGVHGVVVHYGKTPKLDFLRIMERLKDLFSAVNTQ